MKALVPALVLFLLASTAHAAQLYKCPSASGGNEYVQKKTSSSCVVVKNAAPPPSRPYIPDISSVVHSGQGVMEAAPFTPGLAPPDTQGLPPLPSSFPPPTALPPPEARPASLPPLPPGMVFPTR